MTRRMKQKTAFIMVYALLLGMLSGFVSDSTSEAAGGEAALPEEPVSAAYVQPIPATPEPIESGEELNNPRTDADGVVTWDCVYFGNYWQKDTNGDGKTDQEDEKQPVKWRVLSVDGDDAFLLADQNLGVQRYNDTITEVTWETCTMRSWLNGYGADANMDGKDYSDNNFLNNAFSAGEQSAILDSNVVNDDNPEYGTEGGNDTSDKVYLLSIGEVTDPAYGFSSDYSKEDQARRAKSEWWLRSPGYNSDSASSVCDIGDVYWYDLSVGKSRAVRPALHINLKASSDALSTASWSYAGTVTSTGEVTGVASPSPVSTAIPTADPGAVVTAPPIPATSEPTIPPKFTFQGYEYSVDEDGGICITNYSGSEKELVIPGEIDGKKVTRIGEQAFGNKSLRSVTIPDSVTKIEGYAFYSNSSMQSITIPDGVTSIGTYAFWYCTNLKSITIPASVTSIGIAAFFYCPDDLVISTTKGSYADDFGTRSGYTVKYIEASEEPTSEPGAVPTGDPDPSSTQTPDSSPTTPPDSGADQTPAPVGPQPPADLSPQITMEPMVDAPSPATPAPEVKEPSPQASAKVKKPSLQVPAKVKKPTVKVKKKSVQLNWKKVSGVSGYEIWISGSKNFSKKTVKKSKTAKFTLKGLKRNRTYYVKIRAYTKIGGKVKYGKWSRVEKVKCR